MVKKGNEIHGGQIAVPGCKGFGVARGNQRELPQEQLKLVGAQAVLEQKHQAIGGDQHPGDHRRVAGRDSVPDRDHLRLFGSMSRNPDRSGFGFALAGHSEIAAEGRQAGHDVRQFPRHAEQHAGQGGNSSGSGELPPTFRGFCSLAAQFLFKT